MNEPTAARKKSAAAGPVAPSQVASLELLLDSCSVPGFASGLPPFRRGSLALFLITLAATALIGDQPLGDALRMHPDEVLGGAVWQPFTASFVYPADSVGLVIGTLFVQWFFGSMLEGYWGLRKYLTFVIGCSIAGLVVCSLLAPVMPDLVRTTVYGGSAGLDLATLTAFGVVFRKERLSLFGAVSLTGGTAALIFGGLNLVGPVARGAPWPIAVPWLVTIIAALLVTTQPWRKGDSDDRRGGQRKPKKAKAKPKHLRVVESLPN